MPVLRSAGATRRSLPLRTSARLGQDFSRAACSVTTPVSRGNSALAVPSHAVRSAIKSCTASPTGLASSTRSTEAARLARYAARNVPAGREIAQSCHHAVEQCTKDLGPDTVELRIVLCLVPALFLADRLERQPHRPIDQVRADGNVLDPVDRDEPPSAEEHFILVSVEPALTDTAARREPADGIAQPVREARYVVERQEVLALGRDKQILFRPRRASLFRHPRINQTGQEPH